MRARNNLIKARESLGLNKVAFAHLIGISQGYLTYIEDGRRDPSSSVAQRWLEALGPGATVDLFELPHPPRASYRSAADRGPAVAPPWPNTAQLLCLNGKA